MIKKYAILESQLFRTPGGNHGAGLDYLRSSTGRTMLFDTEELAVAHLVRHNIGGRGIVPYYVKE